MVGPVSNASDARDEAGRVSRLLGSMDSKPSDGVAVGSKVVKTVDADSAAVESNEEEEEAVVAFVEATVSNSDSPAL